MVQIFILSLLSGIMLSSIVYFIVKSIRKQLLGSLHLNTFLNQQEISDSFEQTIPLIDEKLDHFFKVQLPTKLPMISMFIGEKTTNQLKAVFIEELQAIFPELFQSFLQNEALNKKITTIINAIYKKKIKTILIFTFLLGAIWGGFIAMISQLLLR